MANNTAKNSKPAQTGADIEKALAKRLQNTIPGNRFLMIDANNKIPCQYNPSDHSFTITLRDMTFLLSLNNYN